jgi:hypothetical protein
MFRLLRLLAHFVTVLIHIPLMAIISDTPTPPLYRHLRGLLTSMLLIFVLLVCFEGLHFSQLYYMWSIGASIFSWVLYSLPLAKTHVLLYETGNRGHRNVLAFDFFCRILGFSLYWYMRHYNPTGTFKPEWTEVFG